MHKDLSVAILQYSATAEASENLGTIEALLQRLDSRVEYVVLPENALQMAASPMAREQLAKDVAAQKELAKLAKQYQVHLIAGTVPVLEAQLPYSRCYLFNPAGEAVGQYDKIHLFDAAVAEAEAYQESAHYAAGSELCCIPQPWGSLGLAICYDLRFPEQMRQMAAMGMDVLALPAAFTHTTGQKHWEVLLRARAVENQCYVLAANQCGTHADGRQTWGHSMIIGPDGEIIAAAQQQETIITATLSAANLNNLRQSMPVLQHRKL